MLITLFTSLTKKVGNLNQRVYCPNWEYYWVLCQPQYSEHVEELVILIVMHLTAASARLSSSDFIMHYTYIAPLSSIKILYKQQNYYNFNFWQMPTRRNCHILYLSTLLPVVSELFIEKALIFKETYITSE